MISSTKPVLPNNDDPTVLFSNQAFNKGAVLIPGIFVSAAKIAKDEVCFQPFRCSDLTGKTPITGPLIFLRSGNNPCPNRIQVDVARKFRDVFICFNEDRLISTLKEVARPLSLDVEVGGVGTVYVAHKLRQVSGLCFQQQVDSGYSSGNRHE